MKAERKMTTTLGRDLTVRPPTEADIPRIRALIAASDIALTGEADPWSDEDIRGDWIGMDLERDAWIIEAAGGEVVGYATLFTHGRDADTERFESDGYVHPAHSGQGIGTELLRLLEERSLELSE